MNLEWGDVHLFLTVVRTGSLRAAARALQVDASTVSRRLAQLERAAGARLLERNARRLELTAAGAHVMSAGERMAVELSELGRRIKSVDRSLSGLVRITAPGSLMAIVSRAVHKLGETHPQIEVEVLSLDALLPIDGSQIDVAIRIADGPPDHLVGTRIARLRAAIYAARGYLASHREPLESATHSWVEWDRRLLVKPAFQWAQARFPDRRVAARGLSTLDVHALVRAGVGVGALPRVVGDADDTLKRLLDIPDDVASSIWLLTHPELKELPRIRAVMSALKRELAADKARF